MLDILLISAVRLQRGRSHRLAPMDRSVVIEWSHRGRGKKGKKKNQTDRRHRGRHRERPISSSRTAVKRELNRGLGVLGRLGGPLSVDGTNPTLIVLFDQSRARQHTHTHTHSHKFGRRETSDDSAIA